MKRAIALLGLCAFAGCENDLPEPDWERMKDQLHVLPYAPAREFSDKRGMRPPPGGTVSREASTEAVAIREGRTESGWTPTIPIAVTHELLESGRREFDVYCAACHGLAGDGDSPVAGNMDLRKPPSLHEPRVREFPPGRIFAIASEGYGLMPSYAQELSIEERWAVVAYVRALQWSRAVALDDLPPELRAEARKALR